jgi:hypothetical protein
VDDRVLVLRVVWYKASESTTQLVIEVGSANVIVLKEPASNR